MGGVAGHAGVFSTAARHQPFCQALLDKLLHNTGPFPLKQSTLQLATSPQAPATAHADATIFTQDQQPTKGVAQRGLGWDLNSAFSRPRGEIFPITTKDHPGSFGHTGFTGTSLWLDPVTDTYVILLANAIHPRGGAPISPLRGAVATAAAKALGLSEGAGGFSPPNKTEERSGLQPRPVVAITPKLHQVAFASRYPEASASGLSISAEEKGLQPLGYVVADRGKTLTGIDVLEQTHFAALKSITKSRPIRIAVLTNQSGLDSHGHRTIDILLHADPQIKLIKIFTPEHGLFGKQDTDHLGHRNRPRHPPPGHQPLRRQTRRPPPQPRRTSKTSTPSSSTSRTPASASGPTRPPSATSSKPPPPRSRYDHDLEIIVLDRPNPIGGVAVQGPVSDPGSESYIDYMPLPVRHGLTLGELARYITANALRQRRAPSRHHDLTVIPMQNWTRNQYFDDTGLPWTNPSPNLQSLAAAILYPGTRPHRIHQHLRRPRHRHPLRATIGASWHQTPPRRQPPTSPPATSPASPSPPPPSPSPKTPTTTPATARPSTASTSPSPTATPSTPPSSASKSSPPSTTSTPPSSSSTTAITSSSPTPAPSPPSKPATTPATSPPPGPPPSRNSAPTPPPTSSTTSVQPYQVNPCQSVSSALIFPAPASG